MKRILTCMVLSVMILGCDRSHKPEITEVSCSPETKNAGTVFTLKVTATDADSDVLTYRWIAETGSFLTATNIREVKWKSPLTGAGTTQKVTVYVSDGENEVSDDFMVLLEEAELGCLEGHVYFTNFKIPVSEVTVTVGDHSGTTNNLGYFFIPAIPVSDYTVTATKNAYSTFSTILRILPNDTLGMVAAITSVNFSSKLSGIVTDQDDQPLENVAMVVLNPDGSASKLTAITNSSGYYRLWYIPFGERIIKASKTQAEDFYFTDLNKKIDCYEIEFQTNLVLQKVSFWGEFNDPRDNHLYHYKTIQGRMWMTDNLAYLPEVSPPDTVSSKDPLYYVYGYEESDTAAAKSTGNYEQYGVLYNFPASKSACPTGWHVPNQTEWNSLTWYLGDLAGKHMKSRSGWINHRNGDNSSGFSAFPGGTNSHDGVFNGIGESANFWTTTAVSYLRPGYCRLSFDSDEVLTIGGSERTGCSIRCVKNR